MRKCRYLLFAGLAGLLVSLAAAQQGEDETRLLFVASDEQGTVWANVGLALQNRSDAYIPMVIGVQNNSAQEVELSRERFYLTDLDGIVYTMPTVKQWRKNYGRIVIDRRLLSTGGIPWEVWYRSGRLARSNFFPDLRNRSGNTTIDNVVLRSGFGMVDLMYFEQLRDNQSGRPFILTVQPEGWETPIRLRLYLS